MGKPLGAVIKMRAGAGAWLELPRAVVMRARAAQLTQLGGKLPASAGRLGWVVGAGCTRRRPTVRRDPSSAGTSLSRQRAAASSPAGSERPTARATGAMRARCGCENSAQ